MPTIYKKWDTLKARLVAREPYKIQRRVGIDRTVVIRAIEPEFDPKLPVLRPSELEKWLAGYVERGRKPLSSEPAPSSARQQAPVASRQPPSVASRQTTSVAGRQPDTSNSRQPAANANRQPTPTTSRQDENRQPTPSTSRQDEPRPPVSRKDPLSPPAFYQDSPVLSIQDSPVQQATVPEPEAPCTSPKVNRESNAICQGNIDRLVISEPIDDEYQYLDDEMEETIISKNFKRIKTTNPPNPTKPQTTTTTQTNGTSKVNQQFSQTRPEPSRLASKYGPNPSAPVQPLQASNVQNHSGNGVNDNSNRPAQQNDTQKADTPDWDRTEKQLQNNSLVEVYRDLNHFRSHIEGSDKAKNILHEAVLKCVLEDDTNSLIDLLKLIGELEYRGDENFWSQLVLRLKRKLNTHAQVRTYKVKTNPEWVFRNYQLAMKEVSIYAKKMDITMRLPFHSMVFLIDPLNNYNLLNSDPSLVDKKPIIKTEIKQERQETADSNCKHIERQVIQARNAEGKQTFKISSARGSRKQVILRPRL